MFFNMSKTALTVGMNLKNRCVAVCVCLRVWAWAHVGILG